MPPYAVCRRPCGVSRGSPMAMAAGPKVRRLNLPSRSTPPRVPWNTRSSGPFPAKDAVICSVRNRGSGTVRAIAVYRPCGQSGERVPCLQCPCSGPGTGRRTLGDAHAGPCLSGPVGLSHVSPPASCADEAPAEDGEMPKTARDVSRLVASFTAYAPRQSSAVDDKGLPRCDLCSVSTRSLGGRNDRHVEFVTLADDDAAVSCGSLVRARITGLGAAGSQSCPTPRVS